MPFYPPQISERFLSPSNAGDIANPNAAGRSASFICGSVLQIVLRVENKIVCEAKFKAAGCGFLFAATDFLCEKIVGKSIEENLNIFKFVEDQLGEFASDRKHCLELVWQTWQATINDFRETQTTEWNGDEALICSCFGVSEITIERAITENLLATVEDVTQVCRAGGGCGSCQPLIQEILDATWRDGF